jgi:CubicO group peptidase (beta-lactamase class C family)
MKIYKCVLACLLYLSTQLCSIEIPDTFAGDQFSAFLSTFNSGDREKFQEFQHHYKNPSEHEVDQELHFFHMTDGFILKKIEESTLIKFSALVQEKSSDHFFRLNIEVEANPPYSIIKLKISAVETPVEFKIERMTENQAIAATRSKIDQLAEQGKFSGSILIAKYDKSIFEKSVGFANIECKIPNNLDTKFNLGSMNKMFTAVAIAQLAQQDKLNFKGPIGKYLSDYPNPEIAKVTIHQLLTHTGGTGDIFGPDYEKNIEKLKEPKDYISLYSNRPPEFQPGSRFGYSNYGFVLLGAIVEKISGKNYYDYIREHIYQPAGMTSSGSYWKTEEIPNMAIGYTRKDGSDLKNNYAFLPMRGSSAGGGYSTVEDLVGFAKALLSHKLLNADYTDLVTTGKVDTQDSTQYAYGFEDHLENGVRWFGHSGGAPGINSTLRIYPRSGYIIAVMGNFDSPAADRIAGFIGARLPAK